MLNRIGFNLAVNPGFKGYYLYNQPNSAANFAYKRILEPQINEVGIVQTSHENPLYRVVWGRDLTDAKGKHEGSSPPLVVMKKFEAKA